MRTLSWKFFVLAGVAGLLILAVAMFGFGVFVMPPLYETFCEITGLNQGDIRGSLTQGPEPQVQ